VRHDSPQSPRGGAKSSLLRGIAAAGEEVLEQRARLTGNESISAESWNADVRIEGPRTCHDSQADAWQLDLTPVTASEIVISARSRPALEGRAMGNNAARGDQRAQRVELAPGDSLNRLYQQFYTQLKLLG
jgi:hypothetical protein